MKYDYTVIQDGQTYLAGEDVPEMGSLICVKKYGNIRDYEGLSKDLDKLPLYVGTGSSCLMTDTGDYYKFNAELNEWKKTASTTADIKQAVENYMKENPVEVNTDKTLSEPGKAADAKAVGDALKKDKEAIAVNQEQIATNKEDIGSLKEDLSNKITKFYASNQGETHLADSDNGKIMDMMLYGRSEQKQYRGKNLLKIRDGAQTERGVTVTAKDGVVALKGTATETGWAIFNIDSFVLDGTCIVSLNIPTIKVAIANKAFRTVLEKGKPATLENAEASKVCFSVVEGKTYDVSNILIQIEKGSEATSYEPYVGGQPSPSPDYPQEIKRVVNPVVKVCGKNLLQPNLRYNNRAKINIKQGTKLTLICKNGVVSKGGNLKFETANGGIAWFGFDKGNVKQQITLYDDVVAFYYLFSSEPSESYALYIGDENTYEPYKEQSVQLPYTLNAIPVASGGNVTIDGQQYVADRVVEKDGVFGIERNIREIHTNTKTMNNSEESPGWNKVEGVSDTVYYNENTTGDSRRLTFISNFTQTSFLQNNKGTNNILYHIKHIIGYSQSELIAKAIDVDMYIRLQDAIFEPLPGNIQAKLRTLVTNYPVTNISVISDQLDGYTVFNYPISMANGWNYVKQQLNDNRDYIYDMDIQSAEAYVHSEYAVALTELEV